MIPPCRRSRTSFELLSWNEPSKGDAFPRAVVLDLEGLGSGTCTLAVRTSWPGQKALETQRTFVVQ
jgi:hypothetical protein